MKKLSALQKREAVLKVVRDKENVAKVACEYKVARKTVYSWIKRYKNNKSDGLDAFKPRYVSGKDHPKAKYPEFEKELLRIAAKNPELSIKELAEKVPVSVWAVWNLLDKKNLNTVEMRSEMASQIFKVLIRVSAKKKRDAVYKVVHNNEQVAKVAREYGVARKTIYSWIERYKEEDYDDSLNTFKPRYVKGEEHHNAKYADVEQELLTLVANNPQWSMKKLSHHVPVSLWSVWNLLDKYNLNSKQHRMAFASELAARREARAKAYSLDTSFAYVAHQMELLMAVTRKIPKYASFNLLKPLYLVLLGVVRILVSTTLGVVHNILSTAVFVIDQVRTSSFNLINQIDFAAVEYSNFNFAIFNYFKFVASSQIRFLISIPTIPSVVVDSLAIRLEKAAFVGMRAINASLSGLSEFSLGLLVYLRKTISGSVFVKVPIPGATTAARFILILKANRQINFVYSNIDKAADDLQSFFYRLSNYFRTTPRYAFYYSSLILLFFLVSGMTTNTSISTQSQNIITQQIEENSEQDLGFKIASGEIELEGNYSYRISEDPQFTIQKQVSAFEKAGDNVSRVLGVQDSTVEEAPSVTVKDMEGNEIGGVSVKSNDTGQYQVNVRRPSNLKPGKYAINVTEPSGTNISKEFNWGLLVLNTDKKIYKAKDTVKYSITVLDDNGTPVCDADLSLSIKNNSDDSKVLTTENLIKRNDDCSVRQKTLRADYEASDIVDDVGEYEIFLQAKVDSQIYSISNNLEVNEKDIQDFVVTRGAPIRTAPGEDYPVIINIKANRDYKGKVVERLPKSFLALPYTGDYLNEDQQNDGFDYTKFATKDTDKHQTLVWEVDLKQGQSYKLKYAFSDLGTDWTDYHLGPVTIDGDEAGGKWELVKDLEVPEGDYVQRMRFGSLRAEDRMLQLTQGQLRISMRKAHFESTETPIIELEKLEGIDSKVATESGLLERILGVSREQMIESEQNRNLNLVVEDLDNKIEFETEISIDSEGIEIPRENLKPGKHLVTIRDNTTGNYVEQTFLYGVLALNTNKAVYQTNESAYIQMAALDAKGNTVCDANLELLAIFPDGQLESYNVSEQTITRSETCGANNVTDDPDYYINLPLETPGQYSLQVTNLENGFTSSAKVNVEENPEFSVERVGATRINPFRSSYTMTVNFSANSSFSGVLMERVPDYFQIFESEEFRIIEEQNQKFIRWEIDSQSEEKLQMQYTYHAPRRSPDLYLLGPLALISNEGEQVFTDSREWQLASDAQFARPDSDVSTGTWSDAIGGDNDGILWAEIDETIASDTDYIQSANSPSNDAFEVGLTDVTDPQSTATHTVRVRERMMESGSGGPANTSVTIALKQGASTIASSTYTHGNNDVTTWYTRSLTLTTTEINNITDYSDLRINVSATQTGGTRTGRVEVSWAEMETPDPPPNEPPTITVDQPDGTDDTIAEDAIFTVQYDLTDSDDTVTADFYYDTNNSGLDGTAISGCQNQAEGTNATCTWDTTGVTPGDYYIYGITSDGVSPEVSDYSAGVVTINAAPTINIDQPDGVNDTIAEGANFTVQYDLADTDDDVLGTIFYDTDATGLNGTVIDGCVGMAEGTNATCNWDTTGVAPGDYYVYGTVNDGVNPQVSAYSSGVVTINGAPTVTNASLNGGANINLSSDTTVNIDFTATVTDPNGFGDISIVTGKAYRSGVSGAESCTSDDNDCYEDTSCTLSGCSGNSCTATCTVPIAFFADATDAGTYELEYWLAWIEATDSNSTTGEGTSPTDTTDVNSLSAISAPASITYSNVSPGSSSSEQTSRITNTGNRVIDLRVSGTDMCTDYPTCSADTITVDNQEYSFSTFTYGSGTDLSDTLTTLDTNIAKSSVTPSNSSDDIFWRIGIPSLALPTVYDGNISVVGIVSP